MTADKKGSKGVSTVQSKPSKKGPGFITKLYNLLFHEDVYYRIGGYLIFGLLLFLIAWAGIHLINKQNLLGDSLMVQKFFKPDASRTVGGWAVQHFGANWKIFKWNIEVGKAFNVWGNVAILTVKYFFNHLLIIIPFIFLFNFFKVGRWNFGAIYFGFYTLLWGAVVGTNSMSFPVGNNLILGPLVLFARYGLWTWFSYLLLVVSTSQFAWVVAPQWTAWAWKQERKLWPVSFTPEQREVFIYGLLFLLASSFAEARIFVHYNL